MKKFTLPVFAVMACSFIALAPAMAQEQKNLFKPQQSEMNSEYEKAQEQQERQQELQPVPYGPQQPEEGADVVNPYSDKYRSVTKKHLKDYQSALDEKEGKPKKIRGLMPNYVYASGFMRMPGAKDGETMMRVATPVQLTGCLKLKNPTFEIQSHGSTMELRLTEAELTIDRSKRYAHFQCDTRIKYAYVDVPLNRDELMAQGIEKIVLQNDVGRFADIMIDANEHRINATSKPSPIMGANADMIGGQTATYWFYPKNTVILSAPRAKFNKATRAALREAARRRGLTPLEDVVDEFMPEPHIRDSLYFVDSSGSTAEQVASAGKPVMFGSIQTKELFSGPQGKYDRLKNVEVFARLPNMYE